MVTVQVKMVDGRQFYLYLYGGEVKSYELERKTFPEDLPQIIQWLNKYSAYDKIEITTV